MNFDIKNLKNIKMVDFIKIKQVLGIILGAQSWVSKERSSGQLGYNLGAFKQVLGIMLTVWDPQVRGRKRISLV